jgi:hypothetical protein
MGRPLDADETAAIDRWLAKRPPTRCPTTGRGRLPHLQALVTLRQRINRSFDLGKALKQKAA